MKKKIYVIGSGFSSLSAACYLAKDGYDVTILEKNAQPGGRARQFLKDGFSFDMGPTWYWMPDVFERFFADFEKKPSDYYDLERLSPAYKVFFGSQDTITIAGDFESIAAEFENIEKGSGNTLRKFIKSAQTNYDIAIKDLVYNPGVSPLELINSKTILKAGQFFSTISGDVRKLFKNPKLIQILEFPALFLGAKPSDTPSFYNFMNYADFGLGTWHPKNGMYSVVKGMTALAKELNVKFVYDSNVEKIVVTKGVADGIVVNGKLVSADIVVSGADYHHTETLLELPYRQYTANYWDKRTFAPSALLFYVGFDKKVSNIEHHTLFFDTDFQKHAEAIYDQPEWPEAPLFYASFPSKTDAGSAPVGMEAGIMLIPLAPGIEDTEELRETYFNKIMLRLENLTEQTLTDHVLFKKSYCVKDFIQDYNSFKGNAYGLANTLMQTAFLRPKLKSGKVSNLYFTGQLTVHGPGVPPALISGKLTAELIAKYDRK